MPNRIVSNSPKDAMPSLSHWPTPWRACVPGCSSAWSNMACASATPTIAAMTCTTMYAAAARESMFPRHRIASVTAGLTGSQVHQQCAHARGDVIAHGTVARVVHVLGIVQRPILAALCRHPRAFVAASHRHDGIQLAVDLVQRFRPVRG